MRILPRQDKGFYLQENQGWEFGFIHSWRVSGHNKCLVGIPHNTVRYWDLRGYFDPEIFEDTSRCQLPFPDFVGVNGEAAKKLYLDSGYPEDILIEVEALRYLHLSGITNCIQVNKKN